MNDEDIKYTVPDEYESERIDKFLSAAVETGFSRSHVQRLITESLVLVNGLPVKRKYKLKTDDVISVHIPPVKKIETLPEDLPINIVYEDSSIAVINKAAGMTVHPGPGNWNGTLVNAIMHHVKDLSSIGGYERPGIVHRLDKDTSGLMVIAKNDISHRRLADDFAERRIIKRYAAVAVGQMKAGQGTIELPIGRHPVYGHKMAVVPSGRPAKTDYIVKKYWRLDSEFFSLLDIKIHSGRTHQIRVHLSHQGTPVVGDPIYSRKWEKYNVPYLLLASIELGFTHPERGDQMHFKADLPGHFTAFISRLDAKESK